MSHVTLHMSPTPIVTANDLPSANSPTIYSSLARIFVFGNQLFYLSIQKIQKCQIIKKVPSFAILAIRSLTRSLQSMRLGVPADGRNTTTNENSNNLVADSMTNQLKIPREVFTKTMFIGTVLRKRKGFIYCLHLY